MDFVSGADVSSLLWISSIRSGEEGWTGRITEDLSAYCRSIELPFIRYDVPNRALLEDALEKIAQTARHGARPFLHFDMHGSKQKGLEIAASKEYVPWKPVVKKLQNINVATGNNLCVLSASCFGLNAIWHVKIMEPCPFYMLIAPESEVSVGFLEDHIVKFYKDVFSHGDIVKAYVAHLASTMKIFHCEKMVALSLINYVRESCKGKAGLKRRERLLSEAVIAGLKPTPKNLKEARKMVRDGVKPTQDLVNRFVETFLIGKQSAFTMDDLLRLIDDADKFETIRTFGTPSSG